MDMTKDLRSEIHGIAIIAYLHACGGEGEIHARDFEIRPGDCSRAVRKLRRKGRIVRIGDCRWRLIQ